MELFQLVTTDTLGKSIDPAHPVYYLKEHPQYFLWVDEQVLVKSSNTWEPLQVFLPQLKAKGDTVVGAIIPSERGFVVYEGDEYKRLKSEIASFAQRRNRLSDRPIVEFRDVEVVKEIPTPFVPRSLTAMMFVTAVITIVGNLLW